MSSEEQKRGKQNRKEESRIEKRKTEQKRGKQNRKEL